MTPRYRPQLVDTPASETGWVPISKIHPKDYSIHQKTPAIQAERKAAIETAIERISAMDIPLEDKQAMISYQQSLLSGNEPDKNPG
ncbi:hypothetical protein M0R04_01470 [Candidatus Dojkabacteria bacterium]|jgi:hypothetical protein|nr:hypothetical protein [Candidatus Dojkabacteria bacterium]